MFTKSSDIPSIEKLREITQGAEKVVFPLPDRKISIYITRFFLHTPITANQVTLIDLTIGLIGCAFLFTADSYWLAVVGGFFLVMFDVFDCVDGEVARYRQSCSKASYFLEGLCHPIMHPLKFLSLGYGLSNFLQTEWIFYLSVFVSTMCYLEQSTNWRREIMLKGEYAYARSYEGVRAKWPDSMLFLFFLASYIMQESGMYAVIFLAAVIDFIIYLVWPELFTTLMFGLNFKVFVLIFYAVGLTAMELVNIRSSVRMIKAHFNE